MKMNYSSGIWGVTWHVDILKAEWGIHWCSGVSRFTFMISSCVKNCPFGQGWSKLLEKSGGRFRRDNILI
jgi:hypothetical protein